MNRYFLVAIGLFTLCVLTTPRQALACELCKPAGLICSADTCEIIFICQGQSSARNSYADCWEDWSGCHTGTEFCRWASLTAPVCKEPALFSHESHEKAS